MWCCIHNNKHNNTTSTTACNRRPDPRHPSQSFLGLQCSAQVCYATCRSGHEWTARKQWTYNSKCFAMAKCSRWLSVVITYLQCCTRCVESLGQKAAAGEAGPAKHKRLQHTNSTAGHLHKTTPAKQRLNEGARQAIGTPPVQKQACKMQLSWACLCVHPQ